MCKIVSENILDWFVINFFLFLWYEIKESGARLKTFSSICGVLPSPEAVDNPLGYKFSWNPLGVLMASQNPAEFLENGKVIFRLFFYIEIFLFF